MDIWIISKYSTKLNRHNSFWSFMLWKSIELGLSQSVLFYIFALRAISFFDWIVGCIIKLLDLSLKGAALDRAYHVEEWNHSNWRATVWISWRTLPLWVDFFHFISVVSSERFNEDWIKRMDFWFNAFAFWSISHWRLERREDFLHRTVIQ